MRRRIWFLLALATAACAEEVIPSFGDLQTPVALAVHQPSGRVLVASQDADELRVFDLESREYLAAPAVSFPLSIPTVPSPRLLVAGERFAFVVSGADGAVGFVDAVAPPGAFGPRSVDDDEGRPVAVFGGLLPTAALPLVSPHHYAEGLGDHALVGGLSLDGTGSRIVVVRPPFEGVEPEVVAELDLPGIGLAGLALEPAFEGDVPDCRAVAIADLGGPGGEGGGIHLGRVRVEADGSVALEAPAERIEVRVEVVLPDGSVEERAAAVRAVEFAPVRPAPDLARAVAADPCVLRSGRLYAILDRAHCGGAAVCPNFAVIDLPSGALATDRRDGGAAAYELPGAPLSLLRIDGPIQVEGAFVDAVVEEDGRPELRSEPAGRIFGLVLVAGSDGSVTFVAGGIGTTLTGPGGRRPSDPAFLLDAENAVPGITSGPVRIDRRATVLPRISFPPEARPRDEEWTAAFEGPLPGLANLGGPANLVGDRFELPASSAQDFVMPLPVLASEDPEEADRLVPLQSTAVEPSCDGFPVVGVEEGGRALRVRRDAPGFSNPPECLEGNVSFAILPPRARPWTLTGSRTGFAGRAPADPGLRQQVRFGRRLLFEFQPPEEAVERGATFRWTTSSGFTFLQVSRSSLLLPASLALYRLGDAQDVRVIVAFSGSDAIAIFDPAVPPTPRSGLDVYR